MKVSAIIARITGMGWLWRILSVVAAAALFGYLYSRSISPVWAAVAIVCFRGFSRFLYRIGLPCCRGDIAVGYIGRIDFLIFRQQTGCNQ